MDKKFIYFGLFIGSSVGAYVPALWGGDLLSMSSIMLSGVGGFLGIYAGYKISQML